MFPPPPTPPIDAFRFTNDSFTYSLGTFQTAVISLDLRVNETACEPFTRGDSVSYSTLGPLDVSFIGFFKPSILGSHISGVDPRGWGA